MAEEGLPSEIRFSRELNTVGAASLGLPILVAAVIFVLHGPVVGGVGPASVLLYLLMGGVFLLALLCYVELQSRSAVEGGAYVLVREAARVSWAFLAGWAVLLGGLLLSGLLALGFAAYLTALLGIYSRVELPEPLIGALLIVVTVIYNARGRLGFRRARHLVTWGVIAALSVLCLLCVPHIRLDNYASFSSPAGTGIQGGLSLLLVGFLAMELVPLTVSEIRKPRRTIPRALFVILSVSTALFLVVTVVTVGVASGVDWKAVRIPLAWMAENCVGRYAQTLLLVSGLLFIPVALNWAILLVVRQAQVMGEDKLLPDRLGRGRTRLGPPHLLLLFTGLGAVVVCLVGDIAFIARVGGFCALFVISMIALADMVERSGHTDSPVFRLPLRPLVPAVALVVSVFLLPSLGLRPLLAAAAWMLVGLLVYGVYARRRYIVGLEGVVVFKSKREPSRARYRVLVPLGTRERQAQLIKLAVALAGDRDGEVLPLRVVTVPEQVPLRDGARTARGVESLFSWSVAGEDTGSVSLSPITRVARSVSRGIIDTAVEEECDLILFGWEGYSERKGPIMGHILDPVIENAPCDVVVLKGDALGKMDTILVPTSGGPHAPIAAEIALKLARLYGAKVTLLYICREGATAEDRQHGAEMITQTAKGLQTDDLVTPKVITAAGVVSGILEEAKGYDLMLLGASEESLFDRFLFGTIPERIALNSPVPVMIAKRRAPLPQFWLRRVWEAISGLFPTLEAEERSTVYREIRDGARADVDFFVMMSLAATIATLGLLLSSPALIIGGMLVAPLMSPIIGIGLAIALGNMRLLRDAAESTVKGIFLTVVVALFLGSIHPLTEVNEEILARTTPDLLDLLVALASGAAGAYAVSRKDVSAALPGVAIAAALVPPLGVVGVGVAMHRVAVAGGGLLLFSTNLVGITLAGSINFLLLGFRPARGVRERESHLRRGLVISMLLFLAISLPLAFISGSTIQATQEREVISRVLDEELDGLEGVSLVSLELGHQGSGTDVTVTVYAVQEVSEETVAHLDDLVTQAVGDTVNLHLIAIPVSEIDSP